MSDKPTESLSENHFDNLDQRIDDLIVNLKQLKDHMHGLDKNIELIGHALNISQPPIDGKIGIRWWISSKERTRSPIFVIWKKNHTSNRFFPTKVDGYIGIKVKSKGGFAHCYEQTKRMVAIAERQMLMRKSCYEALFKIEPTLAKLDMYQTNSLRYQRDAVQSTINEVSAILTSMNSLDSE